MKNQYFGDINDYLKYGLLRCCAEVGWRVGVCWMLTPGGTRSDGQKTAYLTNPERWRKYDPVLFDSLHEAVITRRREVKAAEEAHLIPGAAYDDTPVPNSSVDRSHWFQSALKNLAGADLLFFDPDNGLETASAAQATNASVKHVYWSEIEEAWSRVKSLLIFQHFPREDRAAYAARRRADLEARLPRATIALFHGANVLFLMAVQPEHRDRAELLMNVVGSKWGDVIATDGLLSAPMKRQNAIAARTGDEATRNEQAVRRLFEGVNVRDFSALDRFFSPSYVNRDAFPGQTPGRVGARLAVQNFLQGIPDLSFTVEDVVAAADRVGVRLTVRGTHLGDFRGVPASGRHVSIGALEMFRMSGGQAVEGWMGWDMLGLLEQLTGRQQEECGMPLKIRQVPESEVPEPRRTGKINEDLIAVRREMQNLASDMVLEIEAGSEKAVRRAKTLVTRAAKDLGARWHHWNVGSKVFAKPTEPMRRRRGRKPKARG